MTTPVPSPAAEQARPLARPLERAWVGGVCAGLAEQFGVPVLAVRVAFVVMSAWRLVGVALYLVMWLVLPRASSSEAPGLDAHRRQGLRSRSEAGAPRASDAGQALALLLVGGGLVWFVQVMGWGLETRPFVFAWVAALSVGVVWWQSDRTYEPVTPGRWKWLAPLVARWSTIAWLVVGLIGMAASVIYVVSVLPGGYVAQVVGGILLSVAALATLAAPWLVRFKVALAEAREQKLLSDARADMAAHLHDSVLQTLALIQRQADDPRAVVRLARRQERELREWLYGEAESGADTIKAAITEAAADVEDDFPVDVDTVFVGDAPLTNGLGELVKAAREAMMNAAKHSGAPRIDVYVEADESEVVVFVRDRGKGFDVDSIADDRMGVRRSIIDRMQRHGGRAKIRSDAERGTEVTLEMRI